MTSKAQDMHNWTKTNLILDQISIRSWRRTTVIPLIRTRIKFKILIPWPGITWHLVTIYLLRIRYDVSLPNFLWIPHRREFHGYTTVAVSIQFNHSPVIWDDCPCYLYCQKVLFTVKGNEESHSDKTSVTSRFGIVCNTIRGDDVRQSINLSDFSSSLPIWCNPSLSWMDKKMSLLSTISHGWRFIATGSPLLK